MLHRHCSKQIAIGVLTGLLFWPGEAPAPGGAGVCGVPTCNKMVTPAILGTPEQLMAAVEVMIDEEAKELPITDKLKHFFSRREREIWRHVRRTALLSGSLKFDGLHALLDYAVASGNIKIVKFLLDSGVNPNAIVPGQDDTLFHRCASVPTVRTPDGRMLENNDFPMENRLKAMELILQRGGDLNILDRSGRNALASCRNPAIVDLYVKKGADLSNEKRQGMAHTALESAVHGVIFNHDDLARVKALSPSQSKGIVGTEYEDRLRKICSQEKFSGQCKKLVGIVRSSPGVFCPKC
jgi:ankyrin repeat protein